MSEKTKISDNSVRAGWFAAIFAVLVFSSSGGGDKIVKHLSKKQCAEMRKVLNNDGAVETGTEKNGS